MRQIRPRTRHPVMVPDRSRFIVDLTDGMMDGDEQVLRSQLSEARRAVAEVSDNLAILIHERDLLKARLLSVAPPTVGDVLDPDDRSVVPWGFCEDDDL